MASISDKYVNLLAEVANFSPTEQESYQNSLKHYWDLTNVVETSRQAGERQLLLRLLSRTVGTLPEVLQTQITNLSEEDFEQLEAAFLELKTQDDLTNWLSQRSLLSE